MDVGSGESIPVWYCGVGILDCLTGGFLHDPEGNGKSELHRMKSLSLRLFLLNNTTQCRTSLVEVLRTYQSPGVYAGRRATALTV